MHGDGGVTVNPADYTIRKSVIAWVATVLVLVGGYMSYERLGRFEDPEFVIRQAVVVTSYPGASPAQVAEEITDLIEGAVQQMQEVESVTSVSRAGESLVKVEAKLAFSRNQAELDQVWDKLRSKIADVSRALPPGAAQPVVKGDFGDVFALFYAVTGDGYTPRQLYDYVDFLRRELVLVPGVARVALLGERKEAIFVEISRARAAQFGIPLDQVYATLRAQNVISPAGDVRAGALRLQIQPEATVESVQTLKSLVVAGDAKSGLVRLEDIADIRREYAAPPAVLMRHDGRPAIGLGISNVLGGNVVEMGDAVKQRLAELDGQRPVGMDLNVVSYQSDSVRAAVDSFVANLAGAVAIVVVVLLIFMGLRSGLIIGMVLVLTVAGTLIAMFAGRHRDAAHLARRADHRAGHAGRQRHRRHRRHPGAHAEGRAGGRRGQRRGPGHDVAAAGRHGRRHPRLQRHRPVADRHGRIRRFAVLGHPVLDAAVVAVRGHADAVVLRHLPEGEGRCRGGTGRPGSAGLPVGTAGHARPPPHQWRGAARVAGCRGARVRLRAARFHARLGAAAVRRRPVPAPGHRHRHHGRAWWRPRNARCAPRPGSAT